MQRLKHSPYMIWAKTQTHLPYNLASSGMTNYPLSSLPVSIVELEITGDSYYGYGPLLDAIARKEGVSPSNIFTTIGASLANHIAMASLLNAGDEVLIEQPTYELISSAASYLGTAIKRFPRRPENGYQIDPDDVRRTVSPRTKLIVLTNLHNPSGCYTDATRLTAIGEIARTHGARVLVDEVYLDGAVSEKPRSAVHLGPEFIVTNSLTKMYGLSGLRCGWVSGQPDLIRAMWELNDLFDGIPPFPTEQLSVVALRNLEEIGRQNRAILAVNRSLFANALRNMPDLTDPLSGHGTIYFSRFTGGDVDTFVEFLRNNFETAVVPGKYFDMPEYIRIGLGGENEMFREGVTRLEESLRRFRRLGSTR
jgi:aspartate/methionine/tyrosine aminotransferase